MPDRLFPCEFSANFKCEDLPPPPAKGSRVNNFTFLALRFRLGLVVFKEQKAQ